MTLLTEHSDSADEYEAVALPIDPECAAAHPTVIFRRRATRPTRRAVLHLRDLSCSFASPDMARWYNDRGFHFYVADLAEHGDMGAGRRGARTRLAPFGSLDAACRHLRDQDGIDAIILSAQDASVMTAAMWCDARNGQGQVEALLLANPDFSRLPREGLDIACPVLVVTMEGKPDRDRRSRRGRESVRLGQHVTWLNLPAADAEPALTASGHRRLFDEMGRWLGAYMYGQVRDQLL